MGESTTQVTPVQYGATVTQAQPVYLDSGDGQYKPADADAAATAAAIGIALTPGVDNDYGLIVTSGLFNPGGTVVVGQVYVVSTNPGGIAPYSDLASGDFVTILGIGATTTLIDVDIQVTGIAKA